MEFSNKRFMKKRKKGRKFSRKRDQRKSLMRNLCSQLFLHEEIQTTEAKAKELKKIAEKFLTKAKKDDLATRRYLLRFFPKNIVKKMIEEIAPRYKERKGGYTKVVKLPRRNSDGAELAIIKLLK